MAGKRRTPDVMKVSDVEYRRRMLMRWDFMCVICGREFANLACVTREHIVPKSFVPVHRRGVEGNLAPSHHQCNKTRGVMSIIAAAKLIDAKSKMMRYDRFLRWLNAPVPNRIVPEVAMLPPRRRVPLCLEPPEFLHVIAWR